MNRSIHLLAELFIESLSDVEVKYWALYAQIYDQLKKDPEKYYSLLKDKLRGESLRALNYFYTTYFDRGVPTLAESLITERYVNLRGRQQIEPYLDSIWDILQLTYEPIGGFLTASSKEELLGKIDFAKLVRRDGKIVAAAVYKDKNGRKLIGAGYDGSQQGKVDILKTYLEDIKQARAWGEYSGRLETTMLKYGGVPIPNKFAEYILQKPIKSLNPDGYHYTREIGGEYHEKIIIGKLDLKLPNQNV